MDWLSIIHIDILANINILASTGMHLLVLEKFWDYKK